MDPSRQGVRVREGADDGQGTSAGVRPGALTALLKQLIASPEESPALPSLQPGQVIGRFELVRELGRGGFGVVWEALDRELKRKVAFKLVRPGKGSGGADQLQREAEVVARLSHPNLVTLYDVGRCEQGAYLILELLRGETLHARLDRDPLPIAEAMAIAVDVARGLACAHAEGVVHRDLKPSNVFLTERSGAKILDFGLAHAFGRRRVSGGTPAYMAPEQWEESPEDERTDVFALGVMLHRMLSGEYPFPEDGGKGPGAPRPRSSSGSPAGARRAQSGGGEFADCPLPGRPRLRLARRGGPRIRVARAGPCGSLPLDGGNPAGILPPLPARRPAVEALPAKAQPPG